MSDTYRTLKYNSKARWVSYWYQITEALAFAPQRILLIGKGSGITETMLDYFGGQGISVVTLDINQALSPDVAADVCSLPFRDAGVDVIVCCQVLEHLPFEALPQILGEFRRVAKKGVVISVPHGRKSLKFSVAIPPVSGRDFIFKNPFTKKTIRSKQHFWEIGKKVSAALFRRALREQFVIDKEFLNEIDCYHRFYVLRPKP